MRAILVAWLERAWPWLVIVASAVGIVYAAQYHLETIGAERERGHILVNQLTVARKAAAVVRTEFYHDTVTLTRVIDRSAAVADSARRFVAHEHQIADSLRERVGFLAADSARADSALTYVIAQNDTLRAVVVGVVAQRDSIALYARKVVFAANTALRMADSLAYLNAAIAAACKRATPRFGTAKLLAAVGVGLYLGSRLR